MGSALFVLPIRQFILDYRRTLDCYYAFKRSLRKYSVCSPCPKTNGKIYKNISSQFLESSAYSCFFYAFFHDRYISCPQYSGAQKYTGSLGSPSPYFLSSENEFRDILYDFFFSESPTPSVIKERKLLLSFSNFFLFREYYFIQYL